MKVAAKIQRRYKVKMRVRKRAHGTAEKPRLSVYRSLNHIYAQLIDDDSSKTLASASNHGKAVDGKFSGMKKSDASKEVGKMLAEAAKAKGIKQVVFDRNGYQYHGRVKALADGAREGGLEF
jgi:large subunit ribosomal protein L18